MELVKSHWVADTNRVSLSMPISKVDTARRLVSGFATMDNIDTSDDVVTAEASAHAFARFRGNIREMHQPIAAGRLVDFTEDSFYDSNTQKFYRGIYATAYVSTGAEDTWQKVLDGTLSGFSIGGNITEQSTEFVKEANDGKGKSVRFIKEYDLVELSLVDNPANQLANLDSIVKVFSIKEDSHGDKVMKGMVAETTIANIFWCPNDEIAKNSTEAALACFKCGNAMEQIGWFEKGEDEAVKTAAAVGDFLRQKEGTVNDTNENGEGGVDMANKENEEVAVETDAPAVQALAQEQHDALVNEGAAKPDSDGVVVVDDVVTDKDVKDDETEKAVAVDEAATEPDFEKMFDDLKGSVKDSIEKHVGAVESKVAEATTAFEKKASEFEAGLSELREELKAVKDSRGDVAKRLDALEKFSAIKKSGEVETEPVETVKKGIWGGTFFDSE